MPPIRDHAICIRHWDWSETSQTVSLFGRDHGIIRGLAKGAKREKGAFSGGIELLTRGEVHASVKPGRELATLTSWDLAELFPVLTRRLDAHHAGLYLADVVGRMITDSDPHPGLFDAMLWSLRALNQQHEPGPPVDAPGETSRSDTPRREAVERIVLRFQWRLLDETGYRPELDRDVEVRAPVDGARETLGFSPGLGGFVNDAAGPDRWKTRGETLRCLRAVAEAPIDLRSSVAPSPGDAVDASPHESAAEEAQSVLGAWAGPIAGATAEAVRRANRLLAAYVRTILDIEPPTMRYVFGRLDVAGGYESLRWGRPQDRHRRMPGD